MGTQRTGQERRRTGTRRHQQSRAWAAVESRLARPAGVDHQSYQGAAGYAAAGGQPLEGSEVAGRPAAKVRAERDAFAETRMVRGHWHLHAPGLLAGLRP